eukprot:COSAG05_NODE_204_length_14187_cov_99.887422_17_plen_101_part_00
MSVDSRYHCLQITIQTLKMILDRLFLARSCGFAEVYHMAVRNRVLSAGSAQVLCLCCQLSTPADSERQATCTDSSRRCVARLAVLTPPSTLKRIPEIARK